MTHPKFSRREVEKICRIHAISQRMTYGDTYATEAELARILEDPLAFDRMFSDLLNFIGTPSFDCHLDSTHWTLARKAV